MLPSSQRPQLICGQFLQTTLGLCEALLTNLPDITLPGPPFIPRVVHGSGPLLGSVSLLPPSVPILNTMARMT